jgi:hypothetical protein
MKRLPLVGTRQKAHIPVAPLHSQNSEPTQDTEPTQNSEHTQNSAPEKL